MNKVLNERGISQPDTILPANDSGDHITDWQNSVLDAVSDFHAKTRDVCNVHPENACLLDDIYANVEEIFYADNGWQLPTNEIIEIQAQGGFPTYGELLPSGVDALVQLTGMDQQTVFYDLGSGTGKVVLQALVAHRSSFGIDARAVHVREFSDPGYSQIPTTTTVSEIFEHIASADVPQPSYVYVRHGLKNAPIAALAHFFCDSGVCWLPPYFSS
ncbi:hypothetical protein GUITHDRAFT_133213 [Guillardia theta CCMP2712]|uniref:DOT1 domain-containing protein n=1 Tax=Guillardia theta (strain CCMP2712) TaxID=905079 RepID=L1JY63_GUITC|nr:hypothetical protein GUITHDRAFT_133213 [Guillardia theta CCMP2712]EKX53516.1 hypothetical protein GUITHDRAFT_133213 [Guillardia theta CCMP2712]|eukprot:XP_005840496.1 hypothetical protein GUITHDRAFT_133213 [Guillardia theta CCMP2712]